MKNFLKALTRSISIQRIRRRFGTRKFLHQVYWVSSAFKKFFIEQISKRSEIILVCWGLDTRSSLKYNLKKKRNKSKTNSRYEYDRICEGSFSGILRVWERKPKGAPIRGSVALAFGSYTFRMLYILGSLKWSRSFLVGESEKESGSVFLVTFHSLRPALNSTPRFSSLVPAPLFNFWELGVGSKSHRGFPSMILRSVRQIMVQFRSVFLGENSSAVTHMWREFHVHVRLRNQLMYRSSWREWYRI